MNNQPKDKCIDCGGDGNYPTGYNPHQGEIMENCPTCKGTGEGETMEEGFNKFIVKWCGEDARHLLDDDENDGQRFRNELAQERQRALQEQREGIVGILRYANHSPECAVEFGSGDCDCGFDKKLQAIKNLE